MNVIWNSRMRRSLLLLVISLMCSGPMISAQEADPKSEATPPTQDQTAEQQPDEDSEAPPEQTEEASTARSFDRQNPHILEAIESIKAQAELATVSIMATANSKRRIALGTVVDASGLILTKASELTGELYCRLSDGRVLSATVYGIHQPTDLAMLKVDATGLPTAHWSQGEAPPVGYWLITPRPSMPPSLGIVSVKPRVIRPSPGYMGVNLAQTEGGVRIDRVFSDTPAEKAGILVNDVIVAVDGESKTELIDLQTTIQQHAAGEVVEVTVKRDGQEIKFKIKLADRGSVIPNGDRSDVQNQMGGRLSRRRVGFPMAIQHDTTLSPNECGGPVVDLSGEVVGINIARAGRVDSLALPAATILTVLDSLKSGQLAPAVIYKSEIESITKRLEEITREIAAAPDSTTRLAEELDQQTTREDELQKIINDLQARLDEIKSRRTHLEKELGLSTTKVRDLEKEKELLERDLKRLQTGTN
jgi:serine protease Do